MIGPSEFKYKKELPEIYKERPGIIHIRLGDKGIVNHESQIKFLENFLNKFGNMEVSITTSSVFAKSTFSYCYEPVIHEMTLERP